MEIRAFNTTYVTNVRRFDSLITLFTNVKHWGSSIFAYIWLVDIVRTIEGHVV